MPNYFPFKKIKIRWVNNFWQNKKRNESKKLSYLKSLISNKPFYLFLTAFVIGNIGLYLITYNDYKALALNEKLFELTADSINADPYTLLTDKFNSDPRFYNNYSLLFLSLVVGTELFVIISVVLLWKRRYPKRYLLLSFLSLQFLTAIIPISVAVFASNNVISNLNKQAETDIVKQVELLKSSDYLEYLSVKTDPQSIADSITRLENPPKVIDENTDSEAVIHSLKIENKDTLYKTVILPTQVLKKSDWGLSFEAYLFPNNNLIVEKTSRELLSAILPVLTWKIIDSELGESLTDKKQPTFSILSDDAYNIIQTQKSEKIKSEFLSYFSEVKSSLDDANYYIPLLQTNKKSLEEERVSYKIRTDGILSECRASYSVEDCKPVEDVINKNIASIEKDLRLTNEALQTWIDIKPKLAYNLQQAQANYEKFLKFPLTPELQAGVFDPPNSIYLKYYSEGQDLPLPSDYLSSGIHESLHYQSYNQATLLPTFLNEGITEYLANKLVKKYSLRQNIFPTYPEEVSIIQEIIKTIPENKLFAAYFNQSEKEMENLIDSYYLKGTYQALQIQGEALTYADPSNLQSKEKIKKEVIDLLSVSKQ